VATLRTLFEEADIALRVDDLAQEIASAFPREFTMVGLLKGSFVFVADLARAMDRIGHAPRIEFVKLSSYGEGRDSSGTVRLEGNVPASIAGRPVLLVDDIVDTGNTLSLARKLLLEQGAERVTTCVLLDKPSRRQVDISANLVGFTVPDVFIVGYGFDYGERYRHLPYLATLD
jgi:hypoxanthine phosphoribosyltransferase